MKFTRLTAEEQAEFMELIRDSFDPELYSEDDLPMLRASKKRWEEEQQRSQKEVPVLDECTEPLDEDLESSSDCVDPRRWGRE